MYRILVVDDEAAVRGLLSVALRRAGYKVEAVAGAEEAMRVLSADSFDVVLSDVIMPQMDGHELARWLAVHCPRIRIVLMSGLDPGCSYCPYVPRCKLLGKPFDPVHLSRFIAAVLAEAPPRTHNTTE